MVHVIEHDYVDKMPGYQVGGYDRPIGRIRYFDILGEPVSLRAAEYLRKVQPVARAEVQVALEVLTDAHAKDNLAVQDALNFTTQNRRSLAKMFYDKAASSGTRTGDA